MPSRVASKSSAIPAPDVVSPALLMPALLLFVSGAAALVYQVLWIKQLSLVVGVEVYAITTGISAFFAGLALGGLLFGRWANRNARLSLIQYYLDNGQEPKAQLLLQGWKKMNMGDPALK